jgi:sigma-B regulation protein RsbU (phosphoserine phosphatase)
MRILIADDDYISRKVLEKALCEWGHEVVAASEGLGAWKILSEPESPPLAILDWMMPGAEGPEICSRVRKLNRSVPTYIILLSAKDESNDVVMGLESGADDYVSKPFSRAELQSRIKVGERVIGLQQGLADRIKELEASLLRVKQLQGLLPICAWCKNVRNDGDYWQSVEGYLAEHADVNFTHSICPVCMAREMGEKDI